MASGHTIRRADYHERVNSRALWLEERNLPGLPVKLAWRLHCSHVEKLQSGLTDESTYCKRPIRFVLHWQYRDSRRDRLVTVTKRCCRVHAEVFSRRQNVPMP